MAKPTSKLQLLKAERGRKEWFRSESGKSSLLTAGTSDRKLEILCWQGSIPLSFHEVVGCWLEATFGRHLVPTFAGSESSVATDEASRSFVQPKKTSNDRDSAA